MSNQELTNLLAKRVFGNLGAVPSKIGTIGLCCKENTFARNLEIMEGGKILSFPVWAGQAFTTDNSSIKILVANLGDSVPDLALILNQESAILAIRFSYEDNDSGLFLTHHGETWTEMSMDYQLNLTAAIELLTQKGYSWFPIQDSVSGSNLFSLLHSLLSEDNEE